MISLLSADEMQQVDAYTMETIGIPSLVLMERAALSVTEVIAGYVKKAEEGLFCRSSEKILVVAGTGNNGGDGIAVARQLKQLGYEVDLYILGNPENGSEGFLRQLSIAGKLEISVVEEIKNQYNVIVDGIFGIGLSRDVEGRYAQVIKQLNEMNGYRIAIDIPSGIDATTGQVMGTAFEADITVTFGYSKIGQILYPGKTYCGQVICSDIGFPKQAAREFQENLVCYTEEDLLRLPQRSSRSNKGTYGKTLIVAGRKNMAGAAYLSAEAAYRMGCGLVQIMTEENNRSIIQKMVPEAVLQTYCDVREAKELLSNELRNASSIVVGPGLGNTEETKELVTVILQQAEIPVLIDADGLNVIGECPDLQELLKKHQASVVITPHLKEMSRLCGKSVKEIANQLIAVAKDYGKEYNVTVVLKDARTVVAEPDGRAYLNVSGNHGMATGGSGDVLSGIIGSLLAQGMEAFEAAKLGTYIHGLAGDKAAEEKGCRSMMAGDILGHIASITSGI